MLWFKLRLITNVMMFHNQKLLIFFIISMQILKSQNDYGQISSYFNPLNDPTVEGQTNFVEELMDIAGYNPEKIEIYQTLPNGAKVFRVKLDSVNGGFVFIRWDSKKKENYVANKMIDPGVYFNLKAAKEIMRKQTDKANFTVEDVLPQAPDQEQINIGELNQFREEFELKEEEKRLEEEEAQKSRLKKEKSKEKTKKKLFN